LDLGLPLIILGLECFRRMQQELFQRHRHSL
jgi:hypothetical protein